MNLDTQQHSESNAIPFAALKEKIANLESELLNEFPQIRSILDDIKIQLVANPDCVTILSPDEIGQIVSGLMIYKKQFIIPPKKEKEPKEPKAAKEPKINKATKAIKHSSIDDL